MQTAAPPPGYSGLQIALHWVIALLVVLNWLFSEGMGKLLDQRIEGGATGTPVHVWIGLIVLALVVVRLIARLTRGAPEPPADDPPALRTAANWGHWFIYLLLIGVPLGGAITWFAGVEDLGNLHGLAANLLLLVAGVHALIALWHHYGKKDGLLLRMMRPG